MSNAIFFIFDNLSTTSPPFISIPYLDALPIPAIIAVGVASIKAHGQNTTNIVTDLNIWCVTRYVPIEETSAITTIHVAHLSVKLTIGAFLESASFIIGKPQSIIATHDKLKCKISSTLWIRLINKQIDEIIINVTVFCISDLNNFIMNPPFYWYTHGGIWKLKKIKGIPL